MKTDKSAPSGWQKFVSGLAMFAMASLTVLSFSGCGGSDDDSPAPPPPAPVVAPAAPTALTAIAGADVVNLQWSPPAVSATAGQPASYEVYRSLTVPATAAALVDPANLVTSIPHVTGQATPYSYADTDVQAATTYYYVVTAKNAVGETPSEVASDRVPGIAPGAPTALTATDGENVATLQWTPPAVSATAGQPESYEIYRSTTATTATTLVDPANFVATIADSGQTTPYSYTDLGLPGTNTTYNYVVTAKNADGETPSNVASATVSGPPNPATYGNNFSAALIFADDIGITNLALDPAKSWLAGTADVKVIDYNTGLRPTLAEVTAMLALLPVPQTTLPYLPAVSKINPLSQYYEQKSINTWQGEWAKGGGAMQEVNAKWGDNLNGDASLSSGAKIRIEMVLTKALPVDTSMTVYPMELLSGSGTNELQGTTGIAATTNTAFVMATNARLVIQKFNGATLEAPVIDQALFDPDVKDGLNKLSGEIPVSGNFTYGFVWGAAPGAGKYRLTFKLDENSAFGTGNPANHTLMKTVTAPAVWVSDTEVYIDIDVK